MNRFENKVALVTGSNQGIGAACAIKLARQGADIIIHAPKETVFDYLKHIRNTENVNAVLAPRT